MDNSAKTNLATVVTVATVILHCQVCFGSPAPVLHTSFEYSILNHSTAGWLVYCTADPDSNVLAGLVQDGFLWVCESTKKTQELSLHARLVISATTLVYIAVFEKLNEGAVIAWRSYVPIIWVSTQRTQTEETFTVGVHGFHSAWWTALSNFKQERKKSSQLA